MIVERLIVAVVIVLLSPVLAILSLIIWAADGRPVVYVQKRVGKKGKIFNMYKFRTMYPGAENDQEKLKRQNEADGPVFKIYNDPRLTKVGKFLNHTGMDELPQLVNIIKGEMSIIGPRPLPVGERNKMIKKYRNNREKVLPGILSPWIFDGYHGMNFREWMKSDMRYIRQKSWKHDLKLIKRGVQMFFRMIKIELIDILTGTF